MIHRGATRTLGAGAMLAGAALALSACGGDDGDSSDVGASDLEGRTFLATTLQGATLVEGSSLTLTFADGRVAAAGGCNTSTGSFEVEDGVLTVGELAQTMMACEPTALMDQDTWVGQFLTSDPSITLRDDRLTLASASITIDFEGDAAPS